MDSQLAALRADFDAHARRSMALPIAGALVWAAVGLVALRLAPATANLVLLVGTGAIFPLALGLARLLGERLLDNPSPLAGLMGRCVLMVNLLWVLHLTVFALDPTYLPLTLGIGLGLHWVVFSWVVGHPVGLIHAAHRTVLVTGLWWLIPTHRISAVAGGVVTAYGLSIYLLATRPLNISSRPIPGPRSARRARRNRLALGVVATLLGVLVTGVATEAVLAAGDARQHPAPGQIVELADGRTLHLDVTHRGSGGPTVVLEAGAGLPSSLWHPTVDAILDGLDGPVTVVAYDRAGSAWGGPAHTAPTPDVVVADLREALTKQGLRGPYVLVGHSIGGHYVRAFAATHSDEIAGVVLVDPRPEDIAGRLPELAEEQAQITRMLRWGVRLRPIGITRLFHERNEQLPAAIADQVYALELHHDHLRGSLALGEALDRIDAHVAGHASDLDITPVRIVSAGHVFGDSAFAGALEAALHEAHEAMTSLSDDATRHVIPDADHISILTDPGHARQLAAHVADLVDADD